MTSDPVSSEARTKAIDDLYAVFAPDVVLEAEVEAIIARIVEIDAATPDSKAALQAVDAIERMVAEGQQLRRAEPYLGIIGVQAAKLRRALSGGSVDEEEPHA
jgi:hypothetical protein